MRFTFLLLASLAFCSTFGQKRIEKTGVDTRKYVPEGLELKSQAPTFGGFMTNGEKFDSRYAVREGNVVVLFIRGVWSEPCMALLEDVTQNLAAFNNENTKVVVITAEPGDRAKRLASVVSDELTILSDGNMQISKTFDVIYRLNAEGLAEVNTEIGMPFEEYYKSQQHFIPVTATYVIGQNGYVMWKHFEFDASERPSAEEILDNLPLSATKGK